MKEIIKKQDPNKAKTEKVTVKLGGLVCNKKAPAVKVMRPSKDA